jgi:hypothetical protein
VGKPARVNRVHAKRNYLLLNVAMLPVDHRSISGRNGHYRVNDPLPVRHPFAPCSLGLRFVQART